MSAEERSVNQPEEQSSLLEQHLIRRTKLKELRDAGQDPFQITKFVVKRHSADAKEGFGDLEGAMTFVAGRIMSKHGTGKTVFCDLQDDKGHIQLYIRVGELDEEAFIKFKKTDIGDIMGVEDEISKTKRGEISVKVHEVTLLFKSLRPLPEKFHDPTGREMRYHQRYVDLIMNEDMRRTSRIRIAFIKHMRRYLDERNYLEVETPILNTIPDGATARPFITHHNILDIDMYVHIVIKLNLKQPAVGGFERVREIGRIFRSEGMDPKHSPEPTTIKLYEAYTDFHDMMDVAGGVLSTAAKEALGSYRVVWLGNEIDLAPDQKRMTTIDAVREYVGVGFKAISDDEEAHKAAEVKSIGLEGCERARGTALHETFDQRVEEKLIQPTFITMYSVEMSPLTRRSLKDSRLTERSELFINHCEFANAFFELDDPIDQRGCFEHELALRKVGNGEVGMMDEDFINTLEYGLPPTGGMSIGVDRCMMLLTGSDSICDVILFSAMKSLDKPEPARHATAGTGCVISVAEQGPMDFSKVEIEPLFQESMDLETFAKSDFQAVKVKEYTVMSKSKKLLRFVLDGGIGGDHVIPSSIHGTYKLEELVDKALITTANLPPRKMTGIDSYGMIIPAIHHGEDVERLHYLMVDDHTPVGAKLY